MVNENLIYRTWLFGSSPLHTTLLICYWSLMFKSFAQPFSDLFGSAIRILLVVMELNLLEFSELWTPVEKTSGIKFYSARHRPPALYLEAVIRCGYHLAIIPQHTILEYYSPTSVLGGAKLFPAWLRGACSSLIPGLGMNRVRWGRRKSVVSKRLEEDGISQLTRESVLGSTTARPITLIELWWNSGFTRKFI